MNGVGCVYAPSGGIGPELDHFEVHRDTYREIFTLLGADDNATATLDTAVAVSQAWIRGDYGYEDGLPVELDAEKRAWLRQLCEQDLGMAPERQLPDGRYDSLLVFGASQFGNIRRSEQMARLIRSTEHTFGRVVLLGGDRRLYHQEVAGMRRLLQREGMQQYAENDVWLENTIRDFEAYFPEGADLDAVDESVFRRFGETTQMRVSMIAALGNVVLLDESVKTNDSDGTHVGAMEFSVGGLEDVTALTLLHCPPHPRKNGPARHTTESCVGDFVNVLGVGLKENVAFIGAQPHLYRMLMTVLRAFVASGRRNTRVTATGPELDSGTPVEICASEVYKTLYEVKALRDALAG